MTYSDFSYWEKQNFIAIEFKREDGKMDTKCVNINFFMRWEQSQGGIEQHFPQYRTVLTTEDHPTHPGTEISYSDYLKGDMAGESVAAYFYDNIAE